MQNIHHEHNFKPRQDPTPHLHKHPYHPCLALILALVLTKLDVQKQTTCGL